MLWLVVVNVCWKVSRVLVLVESMLDMVFFNDE